MAHYVKAGGVRRFYEEVLKDWQQHVDGSLEKNNILTLVISSIDGGRERAKPPLQNKVHIYGAALCTHAGLKWGKH